MPANLMKSNQFSKSLLLFTNIPPNGRIRTVLTIQKLNEHFLLSSRDEHKTILLKIMRS
jgi:hypothetical protein